MARGVGRGGELTLLLRLLRTMPQEFICRREAFGGRSRCWRSGAVCGLGTLPRTAAVGRLWVRWLGATPRSLHDESPHTNTQYIV